MTDQKKWSDVYTIKSFEYLSVIISGGEPWFDKPSNKWIDKKDLKKEEEVVPDDVDESEFENDSDSETTDDKEDDGLPF